MTCKKCKKELPEEALFCPYCGIRQKALHFRNRANGTGSAYKRGKLWTAVYVYAWDKKVPRRLTQGGFANKRDALDFIPVLKAAMEVRPETRRRELLMQIRNLTPVSAIQTLDRLGKLSPDADITFKDLYDRWVDWYEPRVGESTMQGYKAASSYYKDLWQVKFADIGTDDMQDCVENCPKGRRTKENMKCLAMQMYKYAASRKIVTHNYAQYIYCGKNDQQVRQALAKEHVEMIRGVLGKYPFSEYVYCLIYTGFRPNEMLSLTKDAFRGDHLVGGFKTEAGTDRIVPISPKIMPILTQLAQRANPYLFPCTDGTRMTDDYFREKIFYPLLDHLGIQPLSDKPVYKPYSCRHTFANLLKDVTGSDTDKAALMGHADASMTKYYQSADYSSLKKIVDLI